MPDGWGCKDFCRPCWSVGRIQWMWSTRRSRFGARWFRLSFCRCCRRRRLWGWQGRRGIVLFVFINFNETKTRSNLGDVAFLDNQLGNDSIEGTRYFDTSLVALNLTERVKRLHSRPYIDTPVKEFYECQLHVEQVNGRSLTNHLMTSHSVMPSPMSASLKVLIDLNNVEDV